MNNENVNKNIKKSILKTIVFFDLFDYPLTQFEIWKYIKLKTSLFSVMNILNNAKFSIINEKNGFYFLNGRKNIIKTRMERNDYACDKLKKANKIAKIFRNIPAIKMISVSNIIGALNLREGSDIDLFIIVDKNKIWRTRFLCVIILELLNLRPSPGNEKDKICLSFFLCTNNLDVKNLRLEDDIYFNYWIINLVPIYNINYTYEKFISTNNWIKDEFPNWKMVKSGHRYFTEKGSNFLIKFFLFFLGLPGEFFLKKIQIWKFAKIIKDNMNRDTRVVVNDDILKLHVTDRRKKYKRKFIEKLYEVFS